MEHNINLAVQILPKSNTTDAYSIIDKAIGVIKRSGLKNKVCPFETVIEGEYDDIMQLLKKMQKTCFDSGAEELLINIKIQIRKDANVSIEEKTGKYD